nr:MAG: RNA-dependent RNA-polymerase [Picobirnavirus sp.]
MPKNNVTRFVNSHFIDSNYRSSFSKEGFEHLRTYMGKVSKGEPKVWTAPFAHGENIDKVLADWNKILMSIETEWPSLYEFEIDLSRKVGPLSVQKPLDQRLDDIRSYYDDIHLSSNPIEPKAINKVLEEFRGLRGLRLRSQKLTLEKMKKSTNSGSPFFTKRRDVMQETVNSYCFTDMGRHPEVISYLNSYTDGPWQTPAVIGWRGQEGGPTKDDVKQRVVWMFPFNVNLSELQVYQPLIEGAQALNLVPAWVSMDSVDKRITNLFDTKSSKDLVVCTDFSKFDQHFNPDLQEAAYAILDGLLTNNKDCADWLSDVFWAKYYIRLVWQILDRSSSCYPGISCFEGRHGMASGSGGTNVDETLVHRALQYEAAIRKDQKLNPNSMCLGDDGILSYPGITVDDVVEAYESHGQECNKSKQYASTQDCVYLRRWHHMDYRIDGICRGVYSTMRAIGRLRYLERFMDPVFWNEKMVALRQLSIIENCKWHPLREEFAQFCMERDKYRLGIDIPGFLENIETYAQESIDHMPDFLGYTKTLQGEGPKGISEWWIVKYLKSHS